MVSGVVPGVRGLGAPDHPETRAVLPDVRVPRRRQPLHEGVVVLNGRRRGVTPRGRQEQQPEGVPRAQPRRDQAPCGGVDLGRDGRPVHADLVIGPGDRHAPPEPPAILDLPPQPAAAILHVGRRHPEHEVRRRVSRALEDHVIRRVRLQRGPGRRREHVHRVCRVAPRRRQRVRHRAQPPGAVRGVNVHRERLTGPQVRIRHVHPHRRKAVPAGIGPRLETLRVRPVLVPDCLR